MIDYLKGVLEDFPEFITGIITSPTSNHLFQVIPEYNLTILDEERAKAFHHTVAHLILVMSRAMQDIKMAIAFLCIQVIIPDEDVWGKLVRVLRYIRSALHLPLILRSDNLSVIK